MLKLGRDVIMRAGKCKENDGTIINAESVVSHDDEP